MFNQEDSNTFDWSSLGLAIIFFVASYFAFSNPISTFSTFTTLFALLILANGLIYVVNFFRFKDRTESKVTLWTELIVGILAILIGIFLMINPIVSESIMTVILSIWFLSVFIRSLFSLPALRSRNTLFFWIIFILDIIGIIVSIFLLFNISVAFVTFGTLIALGFLIAGVVSLIGAFV